MQETLREILLAVISAAVPIVSAYVIFLINRKAAQAQAMTADTIEKGYIAEIARAVTNAVAATSQTYVDSLKKSGAFDIDAQKEAAALALDACHASISADAQDFITTLYGDLDVYLVNLIEAEVRAQKIETANSTI